MKYVSQISTLALAVVAAVAMTAGGQAAIITGTAYTVTATTAQNIPVPGTNIAAIAGATLVANFTLTSNIINLSDNGGTTATLGTFLASGGNLGTITYVNGGSAGTGITNTVYEFTGSAFFTNGASYIDSHDDGTVLAVGGTVVVNSPGPSSINITPFTYSGPTGTQGFDFVYGECCSLPAIFDTTLANSGVPEPTTLILLGTGLGLLGLINRKRFIR